MKALSWIIVVSTAIALNGCASAKKKAAPQTPNAAPQASTAAPEASTEGTKVTCTKGEETRTLEIVTKGHGCALNYTKSGKTGVIASSSHGNKHCQDSQTKIQTHLEQAGYSCK